jgi:hypothetical protein
MPVFRGTSLFPCSASSSETLVSYLIFTWRHIRRPRHEYSPPWRPEIPEFIHPSILSPFVFKLFIRRRMLLWWAWGRQEVRNILCELCSEETTREKVDLHWERYKMDLGKRKVVQMENLIELAPDRIQWRTLVSAVFNILVSQQRGMSWRVKQRQYWSDRSHRREMFYVSRPVLLTSFLDHF